MIFPKKKVLFPNARKKAKKVYNFTGENSFFVFCVRNADVPAADANGHGDV